MTLHRFAARRDASEPSIIATLELLGFSVVRLSIEDGPDLLIGRNGITRVAEVKTGDAKLRPGQVEWWQAWRGNGSIVLRSIDDAVMLGRTWARAAA